MSSLVFGDEELPISQSVVVAYDPLGPERTQEEYVNGTCSNSNIGDVHDNYNSESPRRLSNLTMPTSTPCGRSKTALFPSETAQNYMLREARKFWDAKENTSL